MGLLLFFGVPSPAQTATVPAPTAPNREGTAIAQYSAVTAPKTYCPIPYYSFDNGPAIPTIRVMSTAGATNTIVLSLWDPTGGITPTAQLSMMLSLNGSGAFRSSEILDAITQAGYRTGTGIITGTENIACLVEYQSAETQPDYLAAYTPQLIDNVMVFPWVASPRSDLTPILYLKNPQSYSQTFYLAFYVNGQIESNESYLVAPQASLVYTHNSVLAPGENGAITVNVTDGALAGYLALVDPLGAIVEIFEGISPDLTSEALRIPRAVNVAERSLDQVWITQFGTDTASNIALDYYRLVNGTPITTDILSEVAYMSPQQVPLPDAPWAGSIAMTATSAVTPALAGSVLERLPGDAPGKDLAGYSVSYIHQEYASTSYYLPSVQRHLDRATYYVLYNDGQYDTPVYLYIYDANGEYRHLEQDIPAQGSIVLDQANMPELGADFEGSGYISSNGVPILVVGGERLFTRPETSDVDDPYEFNDSYDTATPLPIPTAITAYIGWSGDRDWYSFTVAQPSIVTATLLNPPADYELILAPDPALLPQLPYNSDLSYLDDTAQSDDQGNLSSTGGWSSVSANPGTQSEQLRVTAMYPGTYYAIVVPKDLAAFSEKPYTLTLDLKPLNLPACTLTPTYAPPGVIHEVYIGASVTAVSPTLTLILYNPTRLAQTYAITPVNALTQSLRALADSPSVRGVLYPIETNPDVATLYAEWNAAYCDVNTANQLVNEIRRSVIAPQLVGSPTIRYIVVIGSDEQIPLYRQRDFTEIANEREFARADYAGSAIGAATRLGFYLSDDAYGTRINQELGWRGQYFWRPRLATGRLVETPGDIGNTVDHFLSVNGQLISQDALVTGYDFLSDSAQAIHGLLSLMPAPIPVNALIGETWTSDDLIAAWPNRESPATIPNAPDLVAVNAHFEHWAALPASATTTADLFFNTDLINASAPLSGTVAWSMGCHAGYSVPDASVNPIHPETTPDFPQILVGKGAAWVANTGYGYGTDDGIAGSERLMLYFTQELGRVTDIPIGQALRNAKLRYLQGLPVGGLTPYDAKSIMEATLYGLPMYTVQTPRNLGMAAFNPPITITRVLTGEINDSLYATRLRLQPQLELHTGKNGDFYGIGPAELGWSHGVVGRPLLPSASIALGVLPPGIPDYFNPQGVILLSAALQTETGRNPVVTRPVTDTTRPEPALNPDLGWLSPQLFTVNHFDEDSLPTLSATFALFNARTQETRLLSDVEISVLYTPYAHDRKPPRILAAEALRNRDGAAELRAEASDEEGAVTQFYFTFITADRIWSIPLERDMNDPSGQSWNGIAENVPPDARYILQAVDNSGNVGVAALKGDYIPLNADITFLYLPIVLRYSDTTP